MVIGWLKRDDDGDLAPLSAWQRVEKTQNKPRIPCLLVPQPTHAVLAGELAGALLPNIFGDLPPEVQRCITMHDTGWAMIDAAQIQSLRSGSAQAARATPVAFTANSPQETIEAWTASINSVERLSPAGGLVVSRHFTLLANPALSEHRRFSTIEQTRQRALKAKASGSASDLDRWTAALGFCDLVSLYMLTGLRLQTSFPLAHPSSQEAASAPRVTLRFEGNRLCFSPAVFQSGFAFEVEALLHPVSADGPRTGKLRWEIGDGE